MSDSKDTINFFVQLPAALVWHGTWTRRCEKFVHLVMRCVFKRAAPRWTATVICSRNHGHLSGPAGLSFVTPSKQHYSALTTFIFRAALVTFLPAPPLSLEISPSIRLFELIAFAGNS